MNAAGVYSKLPIPLQNLACSYAGWRRYRARFGEHFEKTLRDIEASGESSPDALHAIQQRRLVEIANRARRHVPHYREMDLPEFTPDERGDAHAGTRRILEAFPVLEKAIYSDAPERLIAEDVPKKRLINGKTSGTTGSALPLWYTPSALAEEYAVVWRLRRRNGARLRSPHFTFGGQLICPLDQTNPPYWRHNAWSRQTLFSLYHMTEANMSAYVDAIHALPCTYVEGYPSSLHLMARAMIESGRTLPRGRLVGLFPSSESLLAFHRADIEEAFGAPIFDRYGTSEFAVSMTGCSAGNLHVDMEFGIVEVEVQEQSDEFERGALLVTGFANDATPFIRYRIGDVGTRSKTPCACGRPGEVFLDVDGRIEDYVVTPDGRWVGRMDHVFKEQLQVAEAQIVQQDTSSIEVLVVPRTGYDERAEDAVRSEIRARLGDEIRIDMRCVDVIPREANGKFRAVRSSVGSAR